MNWAQISIALGIAATLSAGLWRVASAWTKKAMELGAKALAEQDKEREVTELRRSHEKHMERVGEIEKQVARVENGLSILSARIDERERERARRDTQGIPVRSDDR